MSYFVEYKGFDVCKMNKVKVINLINTKNDYSKLCFVKSVQPFSIILLDENEITFSLHPSDLLNEGITAKYKMEIIK